jgi:hypothetical protein
MSVAREWAIPVALGLLVAGAFWAVDDGKDGPGSDGGTTSGTSTMGPASAFLLPFAESHGLPDANTTHLVVTPQGRSAALAELNATESEEFAGQFDWVGQGRLALYTSRNLFTGCQDPDGDGQGICSDPVWVTGHWPLPRTHALPANDTGPRLGLGGYNATRATVYVFDERGLLAATNDDEGNWSRFPGAPTTMDPATWYIGANATAPNGTQHPPEFAKPLVEKLRPLMEGLPVGGVATTRSNAYVSYLGTLFITLRVDALVYAP